MRQFPGAGLFLIVGLVVLVAISVGLFKGMGSSRAPLGDNATTKVDPDNARPEAEPRSLRAGHERDVFVDPGPISNAGLLLAIRYTGKIQNPDSLDDLRSAVEQRGPGGLKELKSAIDLMEKSSQGNLLELARLYYQFGNILIYEGRFDEAIKALDKSQSLGKTAGMPAEVSRQLQGIKGVVSLRQGEIDNCIGCVGPSSCILPISAAAIHKKQAGSRRAIEYFLDYLSSAPGDLRIRWVLNLAYMTLGEYPAEVPPSYLIPIEPETSEDSDRRFNNVAPEVGLISRGPNQAGGSVFDDFTGDGLPDLLMTSLDFDRGASFYVNLGNGKFEDRSETSGLSDQVYALNVTRADFDNDGNLDVLLLRGGWEKPMRMSLLRNLGNSTFEDVTISSGMNEWIASETAAWGDYDNDGLIDVFVGGEYRSAFADDSQSTPDPRNRCRLYHNDGNGKFTDVAQKLGVAEIQCSKGSAWGDYDSDGRLDLFVSNMNAPCRLYHQESDGTFRDVSVDLGVTGPAHAFSCWFWDYDNDGQLDLYVNDYSSSLAGFVAIALKMPSENNSRPRLYRNVGNGQFKDVTVDVGLDREMMPMGANFADIDNDGFLDFYLGTGRMALEALVPNLMFKNQQGKTFTDITVMSGTGHLQKGHGISFADYNQDGYVDLFVEAGGAVPGDRAYNLLFNNRGSENHWLKVKLVGSTTNRAAIGARLTATIKSNEGSERRIYRTIGNNGSFGGNTLVETIGTQDALTVTELKIEWPTSQTTQTFHEIPCDQAIEITEGLDSIKSLKPL